MRGLLRQELHIQTPQQPTTTKVEITEREDSHHNVWVHQLVKTIEVTLTEPHYI